MKIKRTANAGVLLEIDGVSILLDGICGEISPFIATPDHIREEIYANLPDAVAFTHTHIDHYDEDFALFYEKTTQREVLSPQKKREMQVGSVKIQPVDIRHIGAYVIDHISFVLMGSKCIWFMGDASPLQLKRMEGYPRPDVLFVPFAYFNSKSAYEITKGLNANEIVLLHLPDAEKDDYNIRETVESHIIGQENIHVLKIGETLDLY